ncbi:LysR family transcriptional regulator [Phenylobacterium immobile]|uniref:LysR family transcriptional regulator n=1 Tax=Phenylobacterium immobile TaxID=21 RepID=UPI000A64D362|nr:LysR family transcriptional regulator [Phenylobacterium immobile]
MDVRQLRHFVAVADTLHFGRAAQTLGMTQPPLSQSIQALERELGADLFARTRRSVALTAFGADWLPQVRAALEAVERLPDGARRLRDGEAGRLDLSFVSTADYSVLPDLVRRYAALYPEVEIALTEATSDVQIAALTRGEGMAGVIIPPAGGPPATLDYRRLLVEPLVAAAPEVWIEDGRLPAAEGRLPVASMLAAPLIIFPWRSAPGFHDLVTGYYAAHGAQVRIAQEAIQMQTIIALVSAGMGVAFVPASMRNLARAGVVYLPLEGQAPMLETGLVSRRADTTPTLRRFLELASAPG